MSELTLRLKNQRTDLQAKLDVLLDSAKSESGQDRAFTTEENDRFLELERSISDLNEQIKVQERRDQAELARAARAAQTLGGLPVQRSNPDERNLRKRFSITEMLRCLAEGQKLEGAEAEINQEAREEMKGGAVSPQARSVNIPSRFLGVGKQYKRDLEVGVAANGGNLVATTLAEYEPILRPDTIVERLGVNMMTGLKNKIDFPPQTAATTAAWRGEKAAAGESNGTFGLKSLEPHGLSVTSEYSLEFLNQASIGVDRFISQEQSDAIAEAVDTAFFNGSGSGNVPLGALNNGDIPVVAVGTNGGAITRDLLLSMRKTVKNNNGYKGMFKWVSNHEVETAMESILIDSGSGKFLKEADVNTLLGQELLTNTLIPSDLDKGTSTGVCSALLYGRWDKYMVGQWGGVSFTIDPYTQSKNGMVAITTHTWWDFLTRQPNCFVVIKDITTA